MKKIDRTQRETLASTPLPDPVTGEAQDIEIPTPAHTASADDFEIDFDRLKAQGFYSPTDKPERLSLELRAIKRRLLRRLNFQKRGNRRRRDGGTEYRRAGNVILTTSTRPAEGKTFTSINLAISFAVEDSVGTVLVDADLPRPKVLSHFGLEKSVGFTDLIDRPGDFHLRECLRREKNHPLAILSEGTYEGRSSELYSRDEAGAFIRDLSNRFPDRLIIIDAPPVLAMPEAVILARHVDEVVFVVEANETPEPAVATALDEILDVNERVSLVLNRCLVAESAIHYGSYEEYYYRQDRG